jgi:hypothetical protein
MTAAQMRTPAGGPGAQEVIQAGAGNDPESSGFVPISQQADAIIVRAMLIIGDRRLRMMLAEVGYAHTLLTQGRIAPAGVVMLLRDAGPLVCDLCNLPDEMADNGFRLIDEEVA